MVKNGQERQMYLSYQSCGYRIVEIDKSSENWRNKIKINYISYGLDQ